MTLFRMQSLVDAAGEVLGLIDDPLLTPIGIEINKILSHEDELDEISHSIELAELSGMITSTSEGPNHAIRALKRKLQQFAVDQSSPISECLILLENLIRTCGEGIIFEICQKDFGYFLLNLVTSTTLQISLESRTKLLSLIQSWALTYSSDRKLRGIAEVYMVLKDKGVDFPEPSDTDLKDTDEVESFLKELEEEIDHIEELDESVYEELSDEPATTMQFENFLKKRVQAVQLEETEEVLTSSDLDIEGIADVYKALQKKGIELPTTIHDDLIDTEDMEEWMRENDMNTNEADTTGDFETEDPITDDFSKFLEKRINAVNDS